jgi:phosphatidylethanolamine-binding protein (PEBP) family uncharacterized protein
LSHPLAGLGHPPDPDGFAEGEAAPLEGRNDFGTVGFRGPCPPRRHGRHRHRFRLHVLAKELRLAPGAGVRELERPIGAHLLTIAKLGFQRSYSLVVLQLYLSIL